MTLGAATRRKLAAVTSAPSRKAMSDGPHWLNPRWRYVPVRLDSLDAFRERMKSYADKVRKP